jgi:hypothetical protein
MAPLRSRALCLALLAACASSRRPPPDAGGPAVLQRPPANSPPAATLGYAVALLEQKQFARFFEELTEPEVLKELKDRRLLEMAMGQLQAPAGGDPTLIFRKALAGTPRKHDEDTLVYATLEGQAPIILVRRQGQWFLGGRLPPSPPSDAITTAAGGTEFLYIRIPADISPIERGRRFEDPISAMLEEHHLGEVTGGGSMLKKSGGIEYVGIDVDVTDAKKAVPLLRKKLRELKAPKGTVIEQPHPGDDDARRMITHRVW